ncbi:hypothetical protein [Algoriphagus limi]|uniref:TolB-like 6-blade propeller-like n=1 Tax=Algoriphagus limi TaxID=2975273 RepID=A0ABT2G6D8_9BACT|nr:hypothetical protein [Algoriphagus limi]MCS5490707.1 hypothetical protein [Algoriphagus limi]
MDLKLSLYQGCLLTSLILYFISCSEKKKEFFYSEFKSVDSLEVLLPLNYISHTYWTTYSKGDQSYLIEYGLNSNGDLMIHRVNFWKGSYLEPILIPREGPMGFNSTDASVYFHSFDSIFVFPASQESFFLFNSKAKKVDEFDYNGSDFVNYYRSGFYSNAVFFDQILGIPTVSDIRYDDKDYFEKEIPFRVYDLKKEEFNSTFEFPDFIKESFLPSELTGPILEKMGKDRMIVNYRFSDSLYIFNFSDKTIQSIYCGLIGRDSAPLLSRYPSRTQELEYKIKEPDFESVFFRNDKVYRIVSHLKEEKFRDYTGFEILEKNLRGVTLIELDIETKEQRFFDLPIAKYFVFDGKYLIAGGVSSREENGDIYRKFYRYTF